MRVLTIYENIRDRLYPVYPVPIYRFLVIPTGPSCKSFSLSRANETALKSVSETSAIESWNGDTTTTMTIDEQVNTKYLSSVMPMQENEERRLNRK